jgi:hypothetical protein
MPQVIQGYEVRTLPKNTQQESYPVFVQVPAGTTRTVVFPAEFNAVAISIQIENQDGANAASYQVNNNSMNAINLPASSFRSINDQNIVSVTVTSGAAGVCDISAQVVRFS